MLWDYISSVIVYWWALVPGVVMSAIDMYGTLRDRPIKVARKWIFITFLAGLMFAQFLAWADEHKKVLSQVTYMQLTPPDPRFHPSHMNYQEGFWPQMIISLVNNGDYPAINVVESGGLEIYDRTEPFDPQGFETTSEIEDSVWKRSISDYEKSNLETIQPHQPSLLGVVLNRSFTKDDADGLKSQTKILYMLVSVTWTDGTGRHEQDHCGYIPGAPAQGVLTTLGCKTHNGLIKLTSN
jgi:hypothetical protein